MSATIVSITGEAIVDSRGHPTLSITVMASDGSAGVFAVPSGASTGIHEAHELRDNDSKGGGVSRALALLEYEIAPVLVGKSLNSQVQIDMTLSLVDGTREKSRLGGNTLIGISIALAKAAAASEKKETWQYLHDTYFSDRKVGFPRIYANLINGGKHAHTELAFQEYIIVPKTNNMKEACSLISRIQENVSAIITERFGAVKRGDEGGYAVPVADVMEPLDILEKATENLGVRDEVDFALDIAASSFFNNESGKYMIDGKSYDVPAMVNLCEKISKKYNILSLEDPFSEDDFAAFATLAGHIGNTIRVGDDLTTTNAERLEEAVHRKSIDAIIIKPNQIGTLMETIDTINHAHSNGIKCIVSHRSGETLDDFIVDLAYACGAYGIKIGARGPAEREAKYSRLLAIEEAQLIP